MKKIQLKKVISIIFALLISQFLYSQNYANNWVFGDFGLEFRDNSVIIRKDYAPNDNRGAGIISDKNGDLLFYSDGLNVLNKNNELMPNGKNLVTLTGGFSLQESIVIPNPGSTSLYYLFTVDPQNGQSDAWLWYSIVDMSLNNGLGDVIVKGEKILNNISNKITAIYHQNQKDIWLVTQQNNTNKYYSYLVSASGLSDTPVISTAGNSNISSFSGQLKISPDGKKIACSYDEYATIGGFDLFDFDSSSGRLSNPMSFKLPAPHNGCNGIEFSPDATKLFVYQNGSTGTSGLYQFNITGQSIEEINQSRVLLIQENNNSFRQMQLAPNGKIYITKGGGGGGTGHLGVITNPNEYGKDCIVKENGLFLEGGSSFVALTPNFIQNYFFKTSFTFDNTCQAHPVGFHITNDYRLDSVRWFFGEGSASNSLNPEFQYSEAGDYSVRLLAYYPEKIDTIIEQITINPVSKFDLGKDTTVCYGHELSVAEGFTSYLWNTGETTRSIIIKKTGNYKLIVSNTFGCFFSDSIFLHVTDLPVINLPDSIKIGTLDSIPLNPGNFKSYQWSTGETTPTIYIKKEAWYSVTVENENGCTATKSIYAYKSQQGNNEDPNGWKLLNPKPSALPGLDICFINSQTGFIINDNHLIGTTDGGNTWEIKTKISSGKRIAFKNNIGYIIGNGGTLYKSTYLGSGWNKLNVSFADDLNAISVISKDTILITGVHNLYVSFDGGVGWKTYSITNSTITDSYFTSSEVGHVGCSNGTILKTIDGGSKWTIKSSNNTSSSNINTIYFADKNTGFVSRGYMAEILKTVDGGETWQIKKGSFDEIYSFSFTDAQNGFCAGEDGVIFKTTNGGSTWEWSGFQNGRYGGTTLNDIYFIDGMTGFATGMSGRILKTSDGGKNWKEYSPTYGNVKQLDFVTDQVGYGLVGNTFFKTTNSGNTWTNIGAPVKTENTVQFDFINENIGYCIAGGDIGTSASVGKVYKTIDGGKTWVAKNKGMEILDANLYAIDFVDENTGYVSGGATFKTVDGGNTWQQLNAISFGQIQFINSTVGYARNIGNYYNRIYKTIDGGKNWIVTFEIDDDINSFHFLDENNGCFVGDDALMYKTNDGAKFWQKITIPYGYYKNVKFYSNNVGYVSDDYAYSYKTINGGASWESVNPPYRVPGIEIFSDNIFIYGGSGLILKNKIDFQPVSLLVNPATNITNTSVTLTGNVASNAGKIEKIRFEHGVSFLNNVVPVVPDTVSLNTLINTSIELNNLQPNTTYNYRLSATYNGVEYSSNILQFKTLPDFQLIMGYLYSVSSNEADLSGNVISNKGDITNIEFQFGTDTLFSQSIAATPVIVAGGTTEGIRGKLTLLKPETKYFTRIKAVHEGVEIFGPRVSFTTSPEYKISLYTQYINGETVNLSANITAYKDTIKNIVFEYGTLRSYNNIVKITPDQVNKNSFGYFQTQLTDLDINTVYFFRLKANLGSETIFSGENILRISGDVIIIPIEVQKISDSSIKLQGLINANGKFIYNIQFEYGTTKDFGSAIFSTPNYSSGMMTNTVQSTLSGLAPVTEYYFRIKATDGTNVYYSEEFTYTTGVNTGIEVSDDFPEVLVYPNPANYYLNIKSPYPIERIEFTDLNGRILLVKTNENLLNISIFPAGLYFIKVYTNKGMVIRKALKN
ncbi:MAG: T9SS type A sorting domain-containing protein [Prolixibacteraceae bacterium]|nr:T9SS type A sorting domain-containing protein [Prolixibacteraceae bacterium]